MLSTWEILTLAILALLVFGPERLPGMARTAGKTVSKLRTEANSTLDELKRASQIEELKAAVDPSELREAAATLEAEARQLGEAADEALAATNDERAPAPFDPDAT